MVYKKADKPMDESPLVWISVWTIVAAILAPSNLASSLIVWLTMMVTYYFIARSLYQIGDRLDDARYFMTNVTVRISNKIFGWLFIAISLIT